MTGLNLLNWPNLDTLKTILKISYQRSSEKKRNEMTIIAEFYHHYEWSQHHNLLHVSRMQMYPRPQVCVITFRCFPWRRGQTLVYESLSAELSSFIVLFNIRISFKLHILLYYVIFEIRFSNKTRFVADRQDSDFHAPALPVPNQETTV